MSWIKLRVNLWTHPKVVTLASRLSVTKAHAVGALSALWFVTDQHADEDGNLEMSPDAMDSLIEVPGFCAAVESIGWLVINGESLQVQRYQEHNGSTAKKRASSQKRALASRSSARQTREPVRSSATREEKRREDSSGAHKFIPPSVDEVRAYCRERGNSVDAARFVDHYTANGWMVGKTRMKNWRAAVRTWEGNTGFDKPKEKPYVPR